MSKTSVAGVCMSCPDLRKSLLADESTPEKQREGPTPLARNESICWAISSKKPEPRVYIL